MTIGLVFLLSALSGTGALDSLVPPDQQLDAVVSRARVFILLNALCGNLTRFAFGPCRSIADLSLSNVRMVLNG